MKTASQAGWSLSYSESSSGFKFVTARSIDASQHYCEYSLVDGEIVPGKINDVGFFDLPLSVCNLIRYWFGTITYTEYFRSLYSITLP